MAAAAASSSSPARRRVAFITGVTGQDGSYLTEFLLAKGYEVHGAFTSFGCVYVIVMVQSVLVLLSHFF